MFPVDAQADQPRTFTAARCQVLRLLNHSHVPVLGGRFPAKYNEFPKVWRELASEMLQVADIYLQELPQFLHPAEARMLGESLND